MAAMSRVDFAFGAPDRLRMACEVVRKHYAAGRPLVVYTQNSQLMGRFDRLLWSFEPDAFIPHVDAADPLAPQTPVIFTTTPPMPDMHAGHAQAPVWLINLDADIPPTAGHFPRILEVIDNKPAEVAAARQRWRAYKQDGHELFAHDVSNTAPAS